MLTLLYVFTVSSSSHILSNKARDSLCTKFSGTHGDRGIFIFPVQLTTSRIGNLTRLIHTLLYVMTIHTYIQHNNSGTFFHIAQSPPPQLFDQSTFHTLFRCLFFSFLFFILLIAYCGPHSISPRFTPSEFLSRCNFIILTARRRMVEFYLLAFSRFPLRKKKHKFW